MRYPPCSGVPGPPEDIQEYYSFTINPSPIDSTVKMDGVVTRTKTVLDKTTIQWEVSRTGYTTKVGSYTLNGKNETLAVVLEQGGTGPVEPEEPPYLRITPTSFTFKKAGEKQIMNIETNANWIINL